VSYVSLLLFIYMQWQSRVVGLFLDAHGASEDNGWKWVAPEVRLKMERRRLSPTPTIRGFAGDPRGAAAENTAASVNGHTSMLAAAR